MTQSRLQAAVLLTGERRCFEPGNRRWGIAARKVLFCVGFLWIIPPAGFMFAESGGIEIEADSTDPRENQEVQRTDTRSTGEGAKRGSKIQRLSMPVDHSLMRGNVSLFADSASVVIRWDAEPSSAYVLAHWSSEGPSEDLLLAARGGNSVVRYVPDPTIDGYPIIELHLAPNQGAAVFGSSLTVDALENAIEEHLEADPDPAESADVRSAVHLEIEVERSDLTLTNIPTLQVIGENVVLFATGGTGTWTFDMRGGNSRVTDHRGSIQFTGQETETGFEGIDGVLKADITDSIATFGRGTAAITANTSGGSIDFEETKGNLNITGDATSVILRRVRAARLVLTGEDLYVSMEDGKGSANVNLTRGDLTVSQWETRIDLGVKDGTTATVKDLDGDIAFNAWDGASLGIFGVTGHVRGIARQSTLEVAFLKSIDLQAEQSEISVEETGELTVFNLTDSTAVLNLYKLRGEPVIALNGSSSAEIELHYPCQVRAEGAGAENFSRISVDGCENLRAGQAWAKPRKKEVGGEYIQSIHLAVQMDQQAELRVRGF